MSNPHPTAPTHLTATATTAIALAWTEAGTNQQGFRVQRAPASVGPWTTIQSVGPTILTATDATVTAGQSYSYRIGAYNGWGTAWSGTVTIDVPVPPPPAPDPTPIPVTTTPVVIESLPPASSLVDAFGNVWALNAQGQPLLNTLAVSGETVDQMALVAGHVLFVHFVLWGWSYWQDNSHFVSWGSPDLPTTLDQVPAVPLPGAASPTPSGSTVTLPSLAPGPAPTGPGDLLPVSAWTLIGAFKPPATKPLGTSYFGYAGRGLVVNPARHSIFVSGDDAPVTSDEPWRIQAATCELQIPASFPPITPTLTVDQLPEAVVLQPFADPTVGTIGQANCGSEAGTPGAMKIGGYAIIDGQLGLTAWRYYDGGCQSKSFWRRPLDLASSSVEGPLAIPLTSDVLGTIQAGWVSGPLADIPTEWQPLLGGCTHFACQTGIPIIERTSAGPDCVPFHPADLSIQAPVLLGYGKDLTGTDHPLSAVDSAWPTLFNLSVHLGGAVWPAGTRSIYYIGRIGVGFYGYGIASGTNPPRPQLAAVGNQFMPRCANASTSADGKRVTLPNMDLTNVSTGGDFTLLLVNADGSELTTPTDGMDSPLHGGGHQGISQIIGKGDSGLPTAYVDVRDAYPPNLTNLLCGPPDGSPGIGFTTWYDPTQGVGSDKGNHGYPYTLHVWHYDANELLAVQAGVQRPWAPRPVELTELSTGPFVSSSQEIGGAALDPTTGHLVVMLSNVWGTYGEFPIYLVYAHG